MVLVAARDRRSRASSHAPDVFSTITWPAVASRRPPRYSTGGISVRVLAIGGGHEESGLASAGSDFDHAASKEPLREDDRFELRAFEPYSAEKSPFLLGPQLTLPSAGHTRLLS
jgi:hypothetical protein